MTAPATNAMQALTLIALGLAIGAMGIYVGEVDDAPGAGGLDLRLMAAGVVLGVSALRNRLPAWAGRTVLAANLRSVYGSLAGGLVTSVVTRPDRGVVVAVSSNIAHADTSALAALVADAFADPAR